MNLMIVLKDVFKKDQIKSYIFSKKRELENLELSNEGKISVTVAAERGRSKSPEDQFRCTVNFKPIGMRPVIVERTNENFLAAIHNSFEVIKNRLRNERVMHRQFDRMPILHALE